MKDVSSHIAAVPRLRPGTAPLRRPSAHAALIHERQRERVVASLLAGRAAGAARHTDR
jgi:hypothetical protein